MQVTRPFPGPGTSESSPGTAAPAERARRGLATERPSGPAATSEATPAAASTAARSAAGSGQVAGALAGAEDAAGRSRTARRDALADDLRRLIQLARELNGLGDLRANADAMQDLAREIAKVARKLAEAERALPPALRRGVPTLPTPPATARVTEKDPAGAARDAPAPDAIGTAAGPEPADGAPADTPPPGVAPFGTGPVGTGPVGTGPVGTGPVGTATPPAALWTTDSRSGRDGGASNRDTRQLLDEAVDVLKAIRKTVRKAELLELNLDPEAAGRRGAADRELRRLENDLRALAGGIAAPTSAATDVRV